MGESVFPLCSPKLVAQGTAAADGQRPEPPYADSRRYDARGSAVLPRLAGWLKIAGATGVDDSRDLHVDASMLAIQAAIDGQGVALGRSVLVEDDLVAGRLIRPVPLALPLRFGYYVVHLKDLPTDSRVHLCRCWLLAEARKQRRTGAASAGGASKPPA
jgi:LysR family transcriptional regulator, glycine cleavage system transcriptional activator